VLQREQVSYEILGMPAHSLAHATRHGAVRCVYLRQAEILTLHPLPSADRNHETRFFEPQIQCPKRGSPRVVRSLLSQEFDHDLISLKEDIRSGPASLLKTAPEPYRWNPWWNHFELSMVNGTTLLVIRPVVGDAASCNGSSVPARSLHKLLTG
jgi:hypothetical protein